MLLNISAVLVVLFFALQLMVGPPMAGSATPGAGMMNPLEPHDFRAHGLECRDCHKTVGLKESGGTVKPVTDICYGCHDLAGRLSHPVDMKPTFALPAGLPLDEQGAMTCSTCHDPHKSYRNALTGEKTMYLRREGPKKLLCMACHGRPLVAAHNR